MILVSVTIRITKAGADGAARLLNKRNKGIKFKNCLPFTNCMSEINNTQIDNEKYLDVVILMDIALIVGKYRRFYGNIIEIAK